DLDRTALATGPSGIDGVQSVWLAYRENAGANPGIYAAGAESGFGLMDLGTAGPFADPELVPSTISASFPSIAVGPNGQAVVAFQDADAGSTAGPTNLHLAIDPDGLRPDGTNPSKPF